ncbi:MAG TPA: CRTAC1 family protein, partial [Anaerolineae bacterium]|nr:CRTAC1 family protein [Anaerolineae bacterium]
LVDVDGDGWLDIVFTRRTGGMTYWHNTGTAGEANRFVRETMPGIAHPAYAMAWADLDNDGDLDLVTGSYDAGLLSDLGNSFLLNKTGGIFVYKNDHGNFRAVPLAGSAQAMAIQLFDADRDGRPDLVVGNDFNVPDYLWLRRDDGWEQSRFDATSHSTMSLDAGDIDNDGVPELFSSDMMPYDDSPATVAAWAPMMASMVAPHEPDDPQVMSNVLQIYTGVTGYQNAARQRGVDATGWTWSAKFGDLDSDGLLDLYAVNGFIESTIFAALPNHELVEENQALRNLGDGRFRPQPAWRLNSTASGRGMAMADLDGDGDLDIVVNNLRAPAQLFENGLCGGDTLQVDLRWPGSGNTQAIGATVALHTDAGTFWRDVRSGSGYLSGDPPRLHFGFPAGARLQSLEIHWPDGAVSYVLNLTRVALLTVTRA